MIQQGYRGRYRGKLSGKKTRDDLDPAKLPEMLSRIREKAKKREPLTEEEMPYLGLSRDFGTRRGGDLDLEHLDRLLDGRKSPCAECGYQDPIAGDCKQRDCVYYSVWGYA
jgi:hypothetical protein